MKNEHKTFLRQGNSLGERRVVYINKPKNSEVSDESLKKKFADLPQENRESVTRAIHKLLDDEIKNLNTQAQQSKASGSKRQKKSSKSPFTAPAIATAPAATSAATEKPKGFWGTIGYHFKEGYRMFDKATDWLFTPIDALEKKFPRINPFNWF